MRKKLFILLATLFAIVKVQAQFVLDCACVAQHASLTVTNCQATIPDICALTTNCFRGTIQPPPPLIIVQCNQNPAVGTPVGPGTHLITVSVTVAGMAPMQCLVPFTVVAPITGPFGLQCAQNKTVNCDAPWTFDPPTVVNPCCPNAALPNGGATVTVVNDVTNGVCPMVITRTWKAVDQCGQSATCSQTVTVVDNVPPTLNCGPNQTINCPQQWSFSTPTYSDNCTAASDMVLSIVSTVTNGVCPRVITRVWRVTDLCGNSATCTETVTIVDNVPPTITCGPNQTVNCGQQWNFSTPVISDNCTPVAGLVLNILSTTTNGACPEVVTRVWEVVDRCGNKAVCTETVTIQDITPPTITCVPIKQVTCGAQWSFDPPTATDNCVGPSGVPSVTIAVVSTVTNGLCPLTVTRAWSATDACGNVSQCVQTVTVFGGPGTLTLNCNALATLPSLQTNACTGYVPDLCPRAIALAQQNCPCPVNCTQSPAAGTPYPPGTYPITITLSDGAGGSATCTVNFVVTAPAAGCNPCPPTLTAVLNTGTTNGNGGLLPTAALEQVWVNVSAPGGPIPMVVFDTNLYPVFSGPWVPASATSAWVSPDVTGIGPVGLYTNRVIYNAKCDKVCLTGRIASDDDGYLYVNGVFVSGSGFTAWSNINHCANFVAGPNVIEFVVNNGSQWTGFRTELEFYEQCCCNTFTNVWNTGMDGTNALAVGQPDPNYVLVSAPPGCAGPAQVVGNIPSQWVPNGPDSQWIGGGPNASCDPGVYHYRICFDLPCAEGASVIGRWTADDYGAVYLNGQLLYSIPNNQNPYSFTGWHPLVLTNGFVCGTNCLDFYVTNAHSQINPTGFRAELTNVWDDCCCGPVQEGTNYHSGADINGLLPANAPDPQLVLSCAPAGVPTGPVTVVPLPNGNWFPNGPDSQWVGPVGAPFVPGGLYCYNYRFTLPPCTNGTPNYAVKGQWMGDDAGTIHVNGIPTGNNLPNGWAFTNWHPISITSGLVPGINFLTFFVTNASFGDTGIRMELTNYATCCDCVINTNCVVSIKCPTDIDVTTCLNAAGQAPVTYPLPTASSTCGTITSIVCTPPSGSPFPLGPTPVNCTATDSTGQSASCSFTVYVIGVPPPVITCPPDITVTAACGAACASVSVPPPVVTGGTLVSCNPPLVRCFPIGSTLITCSAVNICGVTATCSFAVTVLPFTLPCAPVPANLALWLPFDEPSGLTAQNLAGGSVGSLINGVTRQSGSYVNNSLCFDGVNDYVQVANHPAIQFGTGDFSVDAWVKPSTLSSSIRIIAEHRAEIGGQATGWSLFLGGNNGLAFQIGDGNYINYPSTLTVPADGQWHLVAVTVSRSNPNGIRFYVDGVLDSVPRDPTPYPGSVTPPASYPMRVSSRSSSLSGFFPGCIDEVELFRRALTAAEISAIYNAGKYGKCRPGSNGVVPPLVINCPPNQTIFTCSNTATANFKPTASGQLGPIVCVPPSGTIFPIGTNTVTCSVTNICGATNWCSFTVIVKPYGPLSPFPSATYWAGTPDNYLGTTEPANVSACLNTAFSPVPFRAFDQLGNDRVLAHRFTGLPNNIVQAILVVRMKPSLTDPNSNNDGFFLGFGPVCNSSTFVYGNAIRLLPGAVPPTGGSWLAPNNSSTTFTMNLGTLNPALLTKMNSDGFLDVAIHDDTIVDYMQLRIWRCPPPLIGIGVPHSTGIKTNPPSTLAAMARKVLPGFGPIGVGPSICVLPPAASAAKVSEVEFDIGGGNSFSFTTVLDMDAPEGTTLEIVDPQDPMGVPLLTMSKLCCGGGWDLKKCKGGISDSAGFRTTAVNDDGQLLGSFFQTLNEGNTNAALVLKPEDESLTLFPITVTIHRGDGTISVAFPGGTELRACCGKKGWDGTIKGRFNDEEALRKGWDGTVKGRPPGASMITFTPHAPHPVVAPQLHIVATGLEEWLLTSEVLATMGNTGVKRLINALGFAAPEDEQATDARSWHQSTAANDGVNVVSLASGGGVSLDVGHSEGLRFGLHIGDDNLVEPTEDFELPIALRAVGGPWVLTNRPPPPVLNTRFIRTQSDVIAAVDFSPIEATSIRVQLWSNGVLIAEGVNPGPAITPEDAFSIGNPNGGMPNRISMNLTAERALRLFNDAFFSVQGDDGTGTIIIVQGDELRFTPEIPPGVAVPLYFTALEYAGSEGAESLLYDLQRTPYCGDTPHLSIKRRPDLLTAEWDSLLDESLRLQGSEDLNGPWFELGGKSPYPVNTNTAAKFFRLICE